MNALTLRGIVAEELGNLRLHVIGKCGGLGELRKTCWTRELPGFGTRHYASGRKVYIVQARMEGRTRTVTIGNAKVLSRAQAMDVARRVGGLAFADEAEGPADRDAALVTEARDGDVDARLAVGCRLGLANFSVQRASVSFGAALAGSLGHISPALLPALIASFSGAVLRCLGAASSVASTICPPMAR